ncbi:MAG: hypothetical protein NE327_06725, partial [Lentisphaeraceae bacterium]|nr:hypothetical protein [Lentisphaeraceae bacterium]
MDKEQWIKWTQWTLWRKKRKEDLVTELRQSTFIHYVHTIHFPLNQKSSSLKKRTKDKSHKRGKKDWRRCLLLKIAFRKQVSVLFERKECSSCYMTGVK